MMDKPRLDQGPDYERGFIDGMQKQMQSSVDKAVNALAQPQQEQDGCPTCGSDVHDRDALDKAEREIERLSVLVAQPQQEPVAWGVFESNLHDMFFTEAEAVEMAQLKGTHAEVKPLYTKENT